MKILVANPGSNSRKYGIFVDGVEKYAFYFDPNSGNPRLLFSENGNEKILDIGEFQLTETPEILKQFLNSKKLGAEFDAILIRIVAPGDYFAKDHIVDDECLFELEKVSKRAPLHVPVAQSEIVSLREVFGDTKIMTISDSAFHVSRPDVFKYYAFNTDFADEIQVKSYGAHGLSLESVVEQLKRQLGELPEKLIVAHIGSGASITAIENGKSVHTSMGYTPLDGAMMATRCGSIDVSAALEIGRQTHMSFDELEKFLNTGCGLLGVGGSNDFRDIIANKDDNKGCGLAYEMFVSKIQQEIGKMAAVLNGADALVLTATISERNAPLRTSIVKKLGFLGFKIQENLNVEQFEGNILNIGADDSKPIFIVKTNETAAMLRHVEKLL